MWGETSEAMGVRTQRDTMESWSFDGDRTQRDARRAGALMANTDGLFGASAGEFTRHVTGHGLTTRLRCQINSEDPSCSSRFELVQSVIINILQLID